VPGSHRRSLPWELAAVSTVVDRQFAENLPLIGRSFQSLIELTPGVVLTPNNGSETGQFSVGPKTKMDCTAKCDEPSR